MTETWQYSRGHAWRYDGDDVPIGMHMRFQANDEAKAAGLCGCECGVCGPAHSHDVEDGCICAPLTCPCLDGLTS
jgi:hypothetical protein